MHMPCYHALYTSMYLRIYIYNSLQNVNQGLSSSVTIYVALRDRSCRAPRRSVIQVEAYASIKLCRATVTFLRV